MTFFSFSLSLFFFPFFFFVVVVVVCVGGGGGGGGGQEQEALLSAFNCLYYCFVFLVFLAFFSVVVGL